MLALLSPDVLTFLAAHPAITDVLDEMAEPLHACFGQHTAELEVIDYGQEGDFLCLTVHLPHANAQGAAAALACFDETWWVHQCHRTEGLLVIDYATDILRSRSNEPMLRGIDTLERGRSMAKSYAQLRAQMSSDAQRQAVQEARAMEADLPDASPHEARRAYEAFMTIYAPELPAVWDNLPARMQRAWGVVVDTVRLRGQGQDTRESADA